MALPPYNPAIYWKNYEIDTPTFNLLPVEKPDMSPYLVHMTGKNQIINILRGENVPDEIEVEINDNSGYLKSNIPEFGTEAEYDASVVCFTESPTFALDFFRYRSFRRWQNDQRYGIGFSKSELVSLGVRPVIYLDGSSLANLNRLKEQIEAFPRILLNGDIKKNIRQLIDALYPLSYPLLENTAQQGFMWEREWRYPKSEGFVFPYRSIEIICCPKSEEDAIREILGENAENISFIRTWVEYDDVTTFISRQQPHWNGKIPQLEEKDSIDNHRIALNKVTEMLKECKNSLHSIEAYEIFIESLEIEKARINEQKENLLKRITELTVQKVNIQRIINQSFVE